ncbi:hypothetical protein ACFYQT_41345 [Streptomyces tibetensis]|uniref:Uncharacterized protein n=1 Tax=Streptomyces tibetensis TaxID=2382123 RepID=A0ABW6N953_9ACTN
MTRDAIVVDEAIRAAWKTSRLLDNETSTEQRHQAQQRLQTAMDTYGRDEVAHGTVFLVGVLPTQTDWTVEQQASWDTAWRTWRDLADDVQAAVTEHAKGQGTPRHQVETDVKKAARHPELVAGG